VAALQTKNQKTREERGARIHEYYAPWAKSRDDGSWMPTVARAEQPVGCIWTSRIARQAWLAGGAAIGAAREGRAEGEHSSTFWCRSSHVCPSGVFFLVCVCCFVLLKL